MKGKDAFLPVTADSASIQPPLHSAQDTLPGQDRRSSPRHDISVFAVVHTADCDGRTGRYRVAQLRDVSATGIGLRFSTAEPERFKEGREFEILFQFSDQAKPLRLDCVACRKVMDAAGLIIGAAFREPIPNFGDHLLCLA